MVAYTEKPQIKTTDPEYILSLAGFIVSLSGHGIIGLILSAIALNKSHHAGRKNTFAHVGLIVGIVLSALSVVMVGLYLLIFGAALLSGHAIHGQYY